MSTTSVLFLPFGLLFTGNLGPGPAATLHCPKLWKKSEVWGKPDWSSAERGNMFSFKKTWGEKLKNFWICIALYAPFLAHLSTPRVCSSPIIYIPPKKKKINTWDSSHPYKKRAFSFIQEYFILVLRVFLKVLYSIHLWLCWCCWLFCDIGRL